MIRNDGSLNKESRRSTWNRNMDFKCLYKASDLGGWVDRSYRSCCSTSIHFIDTEKMKTEVNFGGIWTQDEKTGEMAESVFPGMLSIRSAHHLD